MSIKGAPARLLRAHWYNGSNRTILNRSSLVAVACANLWLVWTIKIMIMTMKIFTRFQLALQWRNNARDGVSNHQPHDCLLDRLFRGRSKKTSKLRVTGLCEGNSPVTGEFPTQIASSAENVSIWWRHHGAHKPSVKWVPVGPGVLRWCSVVDGWLRVNSHSTLLTLRDTLNGLSGISWLWPECWLSQQEGVQSNRFGRCFSRSQTSVKPYCSCCCGIGNWPLPIWNEWSYRRQMGPMLALWTLLSGACCLYPVIPFSATMRCIVDKAHAIIFNRNV